jgi:hypothetical protein
MNLDDYSYLWTTQKDEFVLVNTELGYGIINKKTQMILSVSDNALEDQIIQKMLAEGNQVYEDILAAYADV